MSKKELKGYQGIFFDEETMKKLVELQEKGLSSVIKDMHITFNYGTLEKFPDELMGKPVTIRIIGYASDGKNSGFRVELPEELRSLYRNQNPPHITVSLGEVDGVRGKAVDTGTMDFEEIEEPTEITGELGYFVYRDKRELSGKVMDNSEFEPEKEKIQLSEVLRKLEETKAVVTHFGADLDNVAAVHALERLAIEKGILKEGEHLKVERVPAGQVKEDLLNIDTGGHKGSRTEGETIVIDGNPAEGIQSASAELASMGIYVPEQIVELADTVPNKVSPLESRTALSLIRSADGETIFRIAEAGLLDKVLTDDQLEEYGLVEAQKKQQEVIDNAVKKVGEYTVELPNGEKAVIAPEQILAGAQIAYELGANYYASVQAHKSGKGSTFAVTSKPGVQLPEEIKKLGKELVERYKNPDGTSGVFLNPNGQMLVAGGFKNPDFSVDYTPEELIGTLTKAFGVREHGVNEIESAIQDITESELTDAMGETIVAQENEQNIDKQPKSEKPGQEPGDD